jgi:hypothetical protein
MYEYVEKRIVRVSGTQSSRYRGRCPRAYTAPESAGPRFGLPIETTGANVIPCFNLVPRGWVNRLVKWGMGLPLPGIPQPRQTQPDPSRVNLHLTLFQLGIREIPKAPALSAEAMAFAPRLVAEPHSLASKSLPYLEWSWCGRAPTTGVALHRTGISLARC